MPRLKVTHPDQTRTEYQFGEQVVTIGREVDNLVVIDEPAISRHHAVIELIEGEWWLRDLGSSNGTLHQGVRIDRTRLADRASFEISGWKFRFSHASPKSASAEVASEGKSKGRAKGKKRSQVPPPAREESSQRRAQGKKRSREEAQAAKPPREAPAPPSKPAEREANATSSAISSPADRPPEIVSQLGNVVVAGSPKSFKWHFKPGWPYAVAAALVLAALSLAIRSSGWRDDLPPPSTTSAPSAEPASPKPVPLPAAAPTVAMRESEPASLPLSASKPPKSVAEPPKPPLPRPQAVTSSPMASGRKVLFFPGADHVGFQPVLSPRLDRVLHVKKTPGTDETETWVDVCLNEEVILRRVRLSTEDQMRFSQDGSAWAIQAQDDQGGRFIALRDRTIRLEGEVRQWLGNRDFSHLATVTRHQQEDHLAIDGVWRSSYHHIRDLRLSQDGLQWAYVAVKSFQDDLGQGPLGERVVTQDGPMPICQKVLALELASQSGRAAWVALQPGGRQEVVTAIGPVWQTPPGEDAQIQSLTLSNHGRRLAWACLTAGNDPEFHLEGGGSWTLPVGAGEESPSTPTLSSGPSLIDTRICFSPDGWHAVFAASGRSSALMSEGGAMSRHSIILLDSLTFSPDSRRFAYVAMEPVADAGNPVPTKRHQASLWLDGKRQFTEENAWVRQSAGGNRILMAGISSPLFSPDSHHLACLRSIQHASGEGYIRQAWLDGRFISERHHHALALVWIGSEILSLAAVHSENDSIERVDHRSVSSAGN